MMTTANVKIQGVTKGAFEAVKGVVHFNPDYTEAICGAKGRKFSDFIEGVTCKRCLARARTERRQ